MMVLHGQMTSLTSVFDSSYTAASYTGYRSSLSVFVCICEIIAIVLFAGCIVYESFLLQSCIRFQRYYVDDVR